MIHILPSYPFFVNLLFAFESVITTHEYSGQHNEIDSILYTVDIKDCFP